MENKRFFTVLNGMLQSGMYKEDRFEEVLEELDIPTWKMVALDEVEMETPMSTWSQLECIEYIRNGYEPMIKKDLLECIRHICEFRYEFYRRSKSKNEETAHEYWQCSRTEFLSQYFDTYDTCMEALPFEFDPFLPVEYNMDRLEEFKKNAELVIQHYHAKRPQTESLIPISLLELGLTKLDGRKAKDLFDLWKRYLHVWDLVEEKEESLRTPEFYLRIGNFIIEKYGSSKTYRSTEIRAKMKREYRLACELIASAESGDFPILPAPKA